MECRQAHNDIQPVLRQINDTDTFNAVSAERSLLAGLRAGCHAPLGVVTKYEADRLTLEAVVLSRDGHQRLTAAATELAAQAQALGRQVAEALRTQGADSIIDEATSDL